MLPKRITLQPDPKLKGKRYKRRGPVTAADQALVTAVVQDTPFAITPAQERSLGKVLRRSKEDIKALVEKARETFVESSQFYVDSHRQAVTDALANGDSKSLEVVAKSAQWALSNISSEGTRIIDKAVNESSGTKIMIGLKVGGLNENHPVEIKTDNS